MVSLPPLLARLFYLLFFLPLTGPKLPCTNCLCRSIDVDGQPASLARAGDGADITLSGLDTGAASAGSVVCPPDFPVPLAAKFEARVVVLDVAIPVLRGQQASWLLGGTFSASVCV